MKPFRSEVNLIIILIVSIFFWVGFGNGKKSLSGHFMEGGVLLSGGEYEGCEIQEGGKWLLRIDDKVSNPLFAYSPENDIRLFLQFDSIPAFGERIVLPTKGVEVCYREKGKMLMFETYNASGWIEFEELRKKSILTGRLEMNLIEPHHNFSNSDFHRLDCSFKLKKSQFGSF